MIETMHGVLIVLGLIFVAGTALSFCGHPHWFIRGWEFPRMQVLTYLLVIGIADAALTPTWPWPKIVFLALVAIAAACQIWMIFPYTPLAPVRVQRTTRNPSGATTLRMVTSNLERENKQCQLWLDVVGAAEPDLVLVLEPDQDWLDALAPLEQTHRYTVKQPQNNCYGMALYSRLKLIDPEVRFIVQDDIPSIHVWVELGNGERVRLHGLHPRPPEPIRDQSAAPRDAELVMVGRDIGCEKQAYPTIVAGDLNDVAWSRTTKLFLRLSGLLDPRRGRGFYNTFHARNPLMRFPLDHVFHSNHFKLVELRRMPYVGSDHFPVLIELSYEPAARAEQPEPDKEPRHEREAQEKIDTQKQRELNGDENGHLARQPAP